ncbi:MAG: NAD(P)-dependent methylenetetrahydromethanopterin dehydrogenase [Planctomycetota bacterium]|nr:NAD(P)-dependent methylenetetrahydromethanopterin dehydrogenase [Planctomycetota bacterium]
MVASIKKKILIQLDTDRHPSVFDQVVAVDSGVDHIFSYGSVLPEHVRELVYGAIFTRAPEELKYTAVFVGGSQLRVAEEILETVKDTFFGPLSTSVMLDCGGCNTTAAAAVLCAGKEVDLKSTRCLVLGATGPVGHRVVRLLAREKSTVSVGSREFTRAESLCNSITEETPQANLIPVSTGTETSLKDAIKDVEVVVAAGAEGVVMLPEDIRRSASGIRVMIDLNAVPPLGIEGVGATAKGEDLTGITCYGAIGVGGTKMKIHKTAIAQLFESSKHVLDCQEVYELGLRS